MVSTKKKSGTVQHASKKRSSKAKETQNTVRVHGKLHDIIHITARGGKKHKVLKPLHVEFHPRDALQVVLGAGVLAVPVGFTQEVWELGLTLSLGNVLLLLLISLLFIIAFTYYNFYRGKLDDHFEMFFLRVGATYVIAFCVVTTFLFLIGKAPLFSDLLLAFKRIVLVSFPASLSGAVSDSLR